jgi:putative ABC transport system substrate-binding protein
MIARRGLIAVLGMSAVVPRMLFAQSTKPPVLIGWLSLTSRETGEDRISALKEGLAALGWKYGAQILIEERWADGQADRLASLAQELAAKKPALIVASAMRAAISAAKSAPKVPIVMASLNDPVAAGLVTNLARPDGMVTGLGGFGIELTGKHVELLLAAAPKTKRVGFLAFSGTPAFAPILEAARRSASHYSVDARIVVVARPDQIEPAMSQLASEGVQGLVILPGAIFVAERRRILKTALTQRWPTVVSWSASAADGALLSYGPDEAAYHRRAAYYVDRILKGAKPGDLPIEQPTTFELVLNTKTAKALGLTMPPEIMVRVTRVIE